MSNKPELPAKQVDGHALDGTDVDERVAGLRVREIPVWHDPWVE